MVHFARFSSAMEICASAEGSERARHGAGWDRETGEQSGVGGGWHLVGDMVAVIHADHAAVDHIVGIDCRPRLQHCDKAYVPLRHHRR